MLTRALAYLLNEHAGLLQAFLGLLSPAGIQFEPRRRVESETGGDGGRPDMSIFDADGNLRVLVENKLWAGLTDAQPVGYLGMLPEDMSSGLLFIVPSLRVGMIWNELQARCQGAGIALEQEREGRVRWTLAGGQRRLLITDWENVLDVLEGAADGAEARSDLFQFRGLIDRFDAEAFLPLRSDEVTNADVPRRIINYVQLIADICMRLQQIAGMTYVSNACAFHYQYFTGRLRWNGNPQDDVYLTLSLPVWRDSGGLTPLWLWVNPAFHLPANFDHNGVQTPDNANMYIPIRLQTDVEQERVIENAVEQIRYLLGGS